MQEIFETNKSEKLRGVIVWIPMIETDKQEVANEREIIFSDSRVKQFWDPGRNFGSLLSRTLKLSIPIAWDVYLIYLPIHAWDTELPPLPAFWMHQQNEEASLYLDASRLKEYVQIVVERTTLQ